jgi:hypothetical protein
VGVLENAYRKSHDAEKAFKHGAALAILSESYNAPVVTVLEGLQKLGWVVYVIGKPNVNSWFVNTVIDDPKKVEFDFVLSDFHWGTRWDHFGKFGLLDRFKVLIDGCDNRGAGTWRRKRWEYQEKYAAAPPEGIMAKELQPRRWTMPLGGYEPDLVFTLQKRPGDRETHYFPLGIHRRFRQLNEGKTVKDRRVDFTNIPGARDRRRQLRQFLAKKGRLPGRVSNVNARGKKVVPQEIAALVDADDNVHSYHRWVLWRGYYKLLNDTKVLLYPGITETTSWWDAPCPWEGYGSGCLVLYETPTADVGQYPVTELCKGTVYGSYGELVDKCRWLHKDQNRLERMRRKTVARALKYFTPVPLTRYFLEKVARAK